MFDNIIFLSAPHLQLASPPGRGRMRAAPSPTPPSHVHSTRHQSTSDEDNNAFEDKEEVRRTILRIARNLDYYIWWHGICDFILLCVIRFPDILLSRSEHVHSGLQSLSGAAVSGSWLGSDRELQFLDVTAPAVPPEYDSVQDCGFCENGGF